MLSETVPFSIVKNRAFIDVNLSQYYQTKNCDKYRYNFFIINRHYIEIILRQDRGYDCSDVPNLAILSKKYRKKSQLNFKESQFFR